MSQHLAPFGNNTAISHSLLRIAFMDDTPASSAVLQGILALSSLKLYGSMEALPFKGKAMSMLSASLAETMDFTSHLRVLAASLLLSSYEVRSKDADREWIF
jgi:hypothetical protein